MPQTKITVVTTNVLKQGDTWTLREVVATDQQGLPITKTLKTFEANLPVGQLIDVEVEQNSNPKYADEYMVSLPGSKRGGGGGGGGGQGLGRSVDLLREQLESLTTRVGALEGRLDALEPVGAGPKPWTPPASGPVTTDDDIPF